MLCEKIVEDAKAKSDATPSALTQLQTHLDSVSSSQWLAAEQRMMPHMLDPLTLAARIAQQRLHAVWGWNLDHTLVAKRPASKPLAQKLPTVGADSVATSGAMPSATTTPQLSTKGQWPRVAQSCRFCDAAGLTCDYRAETFPSSATTEPHTLHELTP